MIDFHCHILPDFDDGAADVETSLAMLRASFEQGIDVMVSTSHFYADEEYPEDFLRRRAEAIETLNEAMYFSCDIYPKILLGAEVLYFPGISQSDGIAALNVENTEFILVEPPMVPWSENMLDDIQAIEDRTDLKPIIAHVDRYMQYLGDRTLVDRVLDRDMVVQVNAGFFLREESSDFAMELLQAGKLHIIGSDCHNMDNRRPNIGYAYRKAKRLGLGKEFLRLSKNAQYILKI